MLRPLAGGGGRGDRGHRRRTAPRAVRAGRDGAGRCGAAALGNAFARRPPGRLAVLGGRDPLRAPARLCPESGRRLAGAGRGAPPATHRRLSPVRRAGPLGARGRGSGEERMSLLPPAADVLPHRPPMILIDELLEAGENALTARVLLRADSPFVQDGRVSSVIAIEYMAQTIAAMAGLRRRSRGEQVSRGYLV